LSATGRSAAAGTGYERHPDDDFATPYWCTRAIVPHLNTFGLNTRQLGVALDPCCGSGSILDVLKEDSRWRITRGFEINHDRYSLAKIKGHIVFREDTLADDCVWSDDVNPIDVLVTNPPYSLAMPIILKAMPLAQYIDCAFLLRINFLGSQERKPFHIAHPSDLYPIPRRPSFVMSVSCKKKRDCGWGVTIPYLPTGELSAPKPTACGQCGGPVSASSSDATEYAWFVWGPGRMGRVKVLDV
jgi:hypothetical protein